MEAIKGLNTEDINRPGTIGEWSVRDALLHIAMWDGEVLKMLAVWRAGQEADWSYVNDYKTIMAFNDCWITNLKHLSDAKVLQMLDSIHAAIIADISAITDDEMKKRGGLPKWVHEITVGHHRDHIPKISAYRDKVCDIDNHK